MINLEMLRFLFKVSGSPRLNWILIFLFLPFLGFSEPIEIKIKFCYDGKILSQSDLKVRIVNLESELKVFVDSFYQSDSTYLFKFDDRDFLIKPYTQIELICKSRVYEIPLDPLYRSSLWFWEFRFPLVLNIVFEDVKKIDRKSGVFKFKIQGGGVGFSQMGFYFCNKYFKKKTPFGD
jgi:hypothetical protein